MSEQHWIENYELTPSAAALAHELFPKLLDVFLATEEERARQVEKKPPVELFDVLCREASYLLRESYGLARSMAWAQHDNLPSDLASRVEALQRLQALRTHATVASGLPIDAARFACAMRLLEARGEASAPAERTVAWAWETAGSLRDLAEEERAREGGAR